MKYISLSNGLSNFKGKKNASIDLAQLSQFGSCPSNLIIVVCMLLFPLLQNWVYIESRELHSQQDLKVSNAPRSSRLPIFIRMRHKWQIIPWPSHYFRSIPLYNSHPTLMHDFFLLLPNLGIQYTLIWKEIWIYPSRLFSCLAVFVQSLECPWASFLNTKKAAIVGKGIRNLNILAIHRN